MWHMMYDMDTRPTLRRAEEEEEDGKEDERGERREDRWEERRGDRGDEREEGHAIYERNDG